MKTVRFIVLLLATLSFATAAVRAVTLQWDTNTLAPGAQGGGGNWTGTDFWFNGRSNGQWVSGSAASFGPTAGTVTVNSAVTADSLSLSTSSYTISGTSTLTLSGADTIEVTNSGDTATISAPIGGTAGFTKTGAGTLTFSSGAANTYSSTATVADGTLNLSKSAGINAITGNLTIGDGSGAASSAIVTQGANNQFADTATITVNTDGFWNLASGNRSETIGTLTVNAGSVSTGSGGLIVGPLTISGGSITTGSGGLTASSLTMGGGSIATGSGVLTLNGNVTCNTGPTSTISGLLNLGGATRTFNGNFGATGMDISAAISNGGLKKTATGTLTLSGTSANTYTGTTTVDYGGPLVLNKSAGVNAIGGNLVITEGNVSESADEQIPDSATVTFDFFSGTWSLNNHSETIAALTMTNGSVTTGSGTLTVDGTITATEGASISGQLNLGGVTRALDIAGTSVDDLDLSAAISNGTGGITKTGAGTLKLTGSSTFTGPVAINGGTVRILNIADIGANSNLGAGSSISFDGGTLEYDKLINGSTNRDVTLNAGSGTISVTSPLITLMMSGTFTGGGGLTKGGPGTLILGGNGANSYSGVTTVADGTLNAVKPLPGNLTIGDGSGAAFSAILIQGADEQIPDGATVTIAADGLWNLASGNHSETIAALTMTAGSVATGSGTLMVNGNIATNANAASATIGGQLNLGGATRTLDVADGAAAIDLNISAPISNAMGGLTKTGAGTLQLSGVNSFSGPVAVNVGTLVAHGGSAVGDTSDVTVASGAMLSIDGNETIGSLAGAGVATLATGGTLTVAGSSSTTFSGSLSGAGGFTRTGSGMLTVTTQPNYTANTLVSGGTLALNNGLSSASSTVTVSAPGTLQAKGTVPRAIAGDGTITATGTLTIGDATSTSGFAFNGTLNVGSNFVSLADIDSAQLGVATTLANFGRLDSLNGVTLASGRSITASASAAISGALINNGTVNGATISGQSLTLLSDVSGTGNYTGHIDFAAHFSPGASPAAVSLENFTLDSTATLAIELGGTTAGSQYDQLNFTGAGLLGGTLNVALINGFNPQSGNSFTLLAGGTISGTFSSIQLPALSGALQWDTSKLYPNGILSVILPGDFNGNGIVDAADYVTWRKGLGTTFVQSDYDVWRAHLGQLAGVGTNLTSTAVPEVASIYILPIIAMAVGAMRSRAVPTNG